MIPKFMAHLKSRLAHEYDQMAAHVIKGKPKDFGIYQHYTGQIYAITLALRVVDEVYQHILLETEGRTYDDNNFEPRANSSSHNGERSSGDDSANSDRPFQLY